MATISITGDPPPEWRAVPGYEGSYEVSTSGEIRSLDRVLPQKNGIPRPVRGRILKPWKTHSGHLQIDLNRDGEVERRTVHRVVIETFRGHPSPGQECCHINGDPSDNRVSNLRWDTKSANFRDSIRHGTNKETRKTHCPRGHVLQAPNLRPGRVKQGKRECLACCRAHSRVRRHPELRSELQRVSDSYYQQIMTNEETKNA